MFDVPVKPAPPKHSQTGASNLNGCGNKARGKILTNIGDQCEPINQAKYHILGDPLR